MGTFVPAPPGLPDLRNADLDFAEFVAIIVATNGTAGQVETGGWICHDGRAVAVPIIVTAQATLTADSTRTDGAKSG